jgi:hypothetical protein
MRNCIALATCLWLTVAVADDNRAKVSFDAAKLREGRYTYQLTSHGENIGKAIIEIRAQPNGTYFLSMDAVDIQQRWSAVVRRNFDPVSAKLDMFGGMTPYNLSIEYSYVTVSGTELKGGESRAVSADMVQQTIDQRVDWASMMAAQFHGRSRIEFDVYDPSTGFSRLVGTKARAKRIDSVLGIVPAIRLDYTIHKSDHTESYSVYATPREPHVMLREDMPNELVSTLIAID